MDGEYGGFAGKRVTEAYASLNIKVAMNTNCLVKSSGNPFSFGSCRTMSARIVCERLCRCTRIFAGVTHLGELIE